jgi:hypothetical protein
MTKKFNMPLWGPYSKKYMGLSRIVDSLSREGARFDFAVHPTLWNSSTPVPNATVPSAYHLWQSSADFNFYSYRYELMWKDKVYADVSFSKINDEAYLMRCEFNNNTDLSQNCILNTFGSLEFPKPSFVQINKPEKCIVINANDYAQFDYNTPRPWDKQNTDGMFKGMFRDEKFYLGEGLGDRCDNKHVHFLNLKPFGVEAGDTVAYDITAKDFENPVFAVRYKTVTDGNARFNMNGNEIVLGNANELSIVYLPYCDNPKFTSLGGAGVELDFIAVLEDSDKDISVETKYYDFVPKIETSKVGNGYRTNLKYNYDECNYSILTHNENTRQRYLNSGSLEDALINRLSNGDVTYDDLKETFSASFNRKTSDTGFFHNTLIKSIFIAPHSTHTEYVVVSKGEFEPLTVDEYEKIYTDAKSAVIGQKYNKDGEKYTLSTEILRATLLTNTVYPVYLHGENVVHHTPGKRWDSFYTWDSGFIGMGLLEFSPKLCQYALDQYLTDDDNEDFAFLLHGSLVPTQFVEYLELLKRSNDKSSLDFLYNKMKRYYEFLRGRAFGSTTAKFDNGLLTTYDYWYSCSGMDDYPAQVEMIKNNAEEYSCPCISTAQIIRAGKIMKMVAAYLDKDEEIAVYDEDISVSSKALNDLAWDEESGYYGYTMYDKDSKKPYIMKTESGENWDKGFDGVYPLVAGAAQGDRRERLIEHIKNPNEMWSAAGISAVDMTASYYHEDGYWNGNVWMSHQWFMWKTMLDNGDTDFAFEIANRALEMWRIETDFSYNTYECFGISTRRGGWFHNFGGLSAPICIWANAYYRPGTVTTGFDLWTDYQNVTSDSAEISFKYYGDNKVYSIIVTLDDSNKYIATIDGKEVDYSLRNNGSMEFTINGDVKSGVLKIFKA